jgi:hypothetical protein
MANKKFNPNNSKSNPFGDMPEDWSGSLGDDFPTNSQDWLDEYKPLPEDLFKPTRQPIPEPEWSDATSNMNEYTLAKVHERITWQSALEIQRIAERMYPATKE